MARPAVFWAWVVCLYVYNLGVRCVGAFMLQRLVGGVVSGFDLRKNFAT